ncbi:hypothetical protein Ancab_004496 [Ancistrocladus abbreviatus]
MGCPAEALTMTAISHYYEIIPLEIQTHHLKCLMPDNSIELVKSIPRTMTTSRSPERSTEQQYDRNHQDKCSCTPGWRPIKVINAVISLDRNLKIPCIGVEGGDDDMWWLMISMRVEVDRLSNEEIFTVSEGKNPFKFQGMATPGSFLILALGVTY